MQTKFLWDRRWILHKVSFHSSTEICYALNDGYGRHSAVEKETQSLWSAWNSDIGNRFLRIALKEELPGGKRAVMTEKQGFDGAVFKTGLRS